MAEAIYRKYRPQTFADVTDQNHVKITLKNQIADDSVSHAYLFAGPRGVGKTTMARLLAKAVNCTERKQSENEPCGSCVNCRELAQGSSLDVIEIDAASNTGVDNVRENIIEAVRFSPNKSKFKVFIIDEVHMLSTSAFNALLKTLEEPPSHAIFVLATTEVHKVPQTILSRCQRFDFHRIAADDIVKRLSMLVKEEGVRVDDEVLQAIARLSEGCLRDGESLLGQVLALGEKEIGVKEASIILPVTNTAVVLDLIDAVSRHNAKKALTVLNTFIDQGGSVHNFTDELIDFVRTMMLVSLEGPHKDYYDEMSMKRMRGFLEVLDTGACTELLDKLLEAKSTPVYDAIVQLPLEIAIVDFCGKEPARPAREFTPQKQGGDDTAGPKAPTEETGEQNNQKQGQAPADRPEETSVGVAKAKESKGLPALSISLQDIQQKWKRCCRALSKRNVALPLVVQKAKPTSVKDGELEVAFGTRFHFDTMNEMKNRKMLEEAVEEVIRERVVIKPVFATEEEEETLDGLVEAFGGSVVE